MELLLNLIWLTLAVGMISGYLSRDRSAARSQGLNAKGLLALGFSLVLLFPIISASDDLHPTVALLEDSVKRVRSGAGCQACSSHPAPQPAAAVPSIGPALRLVEFQPASVESTFTLSDQTKRQPDGRAPPALL